MPRTLALNVDDLDEATAFYSKLFNTAPAEVKPGYANFAVAEPPLKLVLIENRRQRGHLNHLGVEVHTSDAVHAEIARLTEEGMFTESEMRSTFCFAMRDNVWVTGSDGDKWEVYAALADADTFGSGPQRGDSPDDNGCMCCGVAGDADSCDSAGARS
jgi:lactoylglutathione lyase